MTDRRLSFGLRFWERRSGATFALSLSALLLLVFASQGCDRVRGRVIAKAAAEQAVGDRADWLSDGGLHVVLCGTGSPLADPLRAGPCVAVIADGRMFLVDVGPGSWEKLQLWRLPRAQLAGVFLTHFHSDHIAELGEVTTQSWIAGRKSPLPVFGPEGVADVVDGFAKAYAFDRIYRVDHHGEEFMPAEGGLTTANTIEIEDGSDARILSAGEVAPGEGLRVTAFRVNHDPVRPAMGYRFDYNGRSVAISGDTIESPSLIAAAQGVDVLVHEALGAHILKRLSTALADEGASRLAKLANDILDYHTTPVQAAKVGKQADASMLLLSHIVPPLAGRIAENYFLEGIDDAGYEGDLRIAWDGLHVELPAKSDEILTHDLN